MKIKNFTPPTGNDKQREGLAQFALKEPEATGSMLHRFCEPAVSPHPIVGFDVRGVALIECNTVEEAVSVPDVCFVRFRDPLSIRGYRFQRVAFKVFKARA